MSFRRTAVACSLLTLFFANRAAGQASIGEAGTAASRDNHHAFLDAPPPPPAPRGPAPLGDAEEYPRRSWELVPEAGFGAPFCRGASFGADRCGDNDSGLVLGGSALYRLSPYVALGFALSFADFHVEGPAATSSRASFMGFVVRGYFTERGAFDPYVETGIGRGAAAARYSDGGLEVRSDASGPSAMAAVGVDFWVTPYFKLGPSIAYRWAWLSDVRTCAGEACETASVADRGAVGSYATLSVSATLAFGREM